MPLYLFKTTKGLRGDLHPWQPLNNTWRLANVCNAREQVLTAIILVRRLRLMGGPGLPRLAQRESGSQESGLESVAPAPLLWHA